MANRFIEYKRSTLRVQSMDATEADKTCRTDIGFCILFHISVGKPFSHTLFDTTQSIFIRCRRTVISPL